MAWMRRGAAAASLAGERGELWPAGILASLVYAGWLPLLLVVAPPNADDLQFFGVTLITSSAYPVNVIVLGITALAGFLLACLLAAVSEVGLVAWLRRSPLQDHSATSLRAMGVVLLASIPALIAGIVLALGLVARAPAAFTSPDLDTPVLVRLAVALLPHLVALLLAVLVGQVLGGAALRRLVVDEPATVSGAFGAAIRQLVRRPTGPIGVAAVGWARDLALLAASYALLRALWAPIGVSLGPGLLGRPATLLLLVGFVAIWLALLAVAGALHVAISTWWLSELTPSTSDRPPDALGAMADDR